MLVRDELILAGFPLLSCLCRVEMVDVYDVSCCGRQCETQRKMQGKTSAPIVSLTVQGTRYAIGKTYVGYLSTKEPFCSTT